MTNHVTAHMTGHMTAHVTGHVTAHVISYVTAHVTGTPLLGLVSPLHAHKVFQLTRMCHE